MVNKKLLSKIAKLNTRRKEFENIESYIEEMSLFMTKLPDVSTVDCDNCYNIVTNITIESIEEHKNALCRHTSREDIMKNAPEYKNNYFVTHDKDYNAIG